MGHSNDNSCEGNEPIWKAVQMLFRGAQAERHVAKQGALRRILRLQEQLWVTQHCKALGFTEEDETLGRCWDARACRLSFTTGQEKLAREARGLEDVPLLQPANSWRQRHRWKKKTKLQMCVIVGALLSVWQAHPKPSALENMFSLAPAETEHHQDGFLSRDSFKTVRRTDTIIARYPTWPAPPHPKASVPLHTRPACVVGPPPEDAGLD